LAPAERVTEEERQAEKRRLEILAQAERAAAERHVKAGKKLMRSSPPSTRR